MNPIFLRLRHASFAAAATALFLVSFPASLQAQRPNIVVILSDDMGFSDLGCYGGEIETPHLDALAAGGLRFTQFYNTGRCCPTRASLLTGLYPHQAGIGWMMADNGHDGYRGELNHRCVTIAEALGAAGYATWMTGKWHVTSRVRPNPDGEIDRSNWPLQRGFQRFFGTIHGAGSFYDPNSLTRDNSLIAPEDPESFYYTDAISNHAVRFIEDHDAGTSPFFLYVAYTAAHWPMHAKPDDIAKYEGRYDAGWDEIRAQRFARLRELGLVQPGTELSPNVNDWESTRDKEWFAARMEVYAAMVDCMDQGIGRIVDALKRKGVFDNTLVLFLQDNGGCQEEMGSLGPVKPDPSEPVVPNPMQPGELQFDMIPKVTRDGRPVRQGYGVMPGPADTYMAYGIEWANASNTPFRLFKHYVHEGGISTPLIAHWPKGIKRHGELDHQPSHLVDIMATCIDLANADYPDTFHDDSPITPMEGTSLRPAFENRPLQRTSPLFWEHEGNRAIRRDDWKLVAKGADGPWELYNIRDDRSEMHDLAAEQPDLAKQLAAEWQAWAERAHVLPLIPYWPKKETALSDRREFVLRQGDRLARADGPTTGGRAFTLAASIAEPGNGVIAAQGGVAHGFAVYLTDHRPAVAVRLDGKLHSFTADSPAPEPPFTLTLRYARNGKLTLTVNDQTVLTAKVPSTLVSTPADDLSIGSDVNDPVGNYPREFPFSGTINSVAISIK